MRAIRPTPHRGLLAGLLALIVFASSAIAMTAGGSSPRTVVTAPVHGRAVLTSVRDEDGGGGHHR